MEAWLIQGNMAASLPLLFISPPSTDSCQGAQIQQAAQGGCQTPSPRLCDSNHGVFLQSFFHWQETSSHELGSVWLSHGCCCQVRLTLCHLSLSAHKVDIRHHVGLSILWTQSTLNVHSFCPCWQVVIGVSTRPNPFWPINLLAVQLLQRACISVKFHLPKCGTK